MFSAFYLMPSSKRTFWSLLSVFAEPLDVDGGEKNIVLHNAYASQAFARHEKLLIDKFINFKGVLFR